MIAERTFQYVQRVLDPVLGYRVRYPVQVIVIGRLGLSRYQTVGYACDWEHVEKLKGFLV